MVESSSIVWKAKDGDIASSKIELKYTYTPAFRFWVKDPELDFKPKPLMCILCYEATSPDGRIAQMTFAECFGDSNMIETYWIQGSDPDCIAKYYESGELTRESE